MKLSIGYPEREHAVEMLQHAVSGSHEISQHDPILADDQLQRIQTEVAALPVAGSIQEYLLDLAEATRRHVHIALGLSPRGLLVWQRAAQAKAFLNQRCYVTPDDVQALAVPVLSVRLSIDRDDPLPLIHELIETVSVPEYVEPTS